MSDFMVQALRGQPVTVYGAGMQTRASCYADDLVDGFITPMAAPDDVTGLCDPEG